MKILKKIGLIILALIAIVLIAALFVSKELNYEKTITINKPIDYVWEYTNSLEDLDEWSPWMTYDPNMKKELTGVDGTVGAMSAWESDHKNVGKGSQTITKIEAPTLFATDLKFYTPYESEAKAYVSLKSEGDITSVTWGFKSEMPYPFNIMKLTMNMEEAIGKDFELGLSKLKNLCENND
jgi:hypothetical protein